MSALLHDGFGALAAIEGLLSLASCAHAGSQPGMRITALAVLLFVGNGCEGSQLTSNLTPFADRNLEAFNAIWSAVDEDGKSEMLCFAVRMGASGGVSTEEVEKLTLPDTMGGSCKQKWLWMMGVRRDDIRTALNRNARSHTVTDLGPFGFEPAVAPGEPDTLESLRASILSDKRSLGSHDPRIWRLHRLCLRNVDPVCVDLAQRARDELLSIHDVPEVGSPGAAMLVLWATVTAPEPGAVLDHIRRRPGSESKTAAQVLEAWGFHQKAIEIAQSHHLWDMLFRMHAQTAAVPDLKNPSEAQCLVIERTVDDESLLKSILPVGGSALMMAFCSAHPGLFARWVLWAGALIAHPPTAREEDRLLLELLVDLSAKANKAGSGLALQLGSTNDYTGQISGIVFADRDYWTWSDVPRLKRAAGEMRRLGREEHARLIESVTGDITNYTALRGAVLTGGSYALVWVLCILLYPRVRWVRANVIWNPHLRRIFFIFNPLITAIPALRRLMFRPFAADLRGEERTDQTQAVYFPDIQVVENGSSLPLSLALPSIGSRVVLQGSSGLGKTTYLRRLAANSRDPIVYLEARTCEKGVLAAIQERLPGWLKDEEFLGALIFQGGLAVILDGYNEAGPAARNAIQVFLSQSANGSVVVSTQPMKISWPRQARVLTLESLDIQRALDFLVLQGVERPQAQALADLVLTGRNESDRAASRLVFSNPFDLVVIADMLKRSQTPDCVFQLIVDAISG